MICLKARLPWLLPIDLKLLDSIWQEMKRACGLSDKCINCNLVDDNQIAAINSTYLNCIGPTNIITFPGSEIYLSLPALHRECLFYGQTPKEHLIRLLAHGLGHWQDYQHGKAMAKIEQACRQAGIQQLRAFNLWPA